MTENSPKPVHTLKDLKRVRAQLAAARAEEAARLAAAQRAQAEAERRARDQSDLFLRAVGPVAPLRHSPRAQHEIEPPEPIARQKMLDDEAVLRESLSDGFDVTSLLDTDDQLSFRRPGIGCDVTQKLRRGDWSIQRQIDLHGLRRDDAREALGGFIREAHKIGLRCVRVIHGKGLGSPGKAPVLKARVQSWLVQKNEVLAFVQAKPTDGGAGALMVLLKPGAARTARTARAARGTGEAGQASSD
ncbi:MAG: Smr/MutS family protein [Burkholderiales bacterium]